jgi:hypothetical protein
VSGLRNLFCVHNRTKEPQQATKFKVEFEFKYKAHDFALTVAIPTANASITTEQVSFPVKH